MQKAIKTPVDQDTREQSAYILVMAHYIAYCQISWNFLRQQLQIKIIENNSRPYLADGWAAGVARVMDTPLDIHHHSACVR